MSYDQLNEQELGELVGKTQAHYREKIRLWSILSTRDGCWS